MFNGYFLDVHFTHSFYKQILRVKVTYHDIEFIDPDCYKNLKRMKNAQENWDLTLWVLFSSIQDMSLGTRSKEYIIFVGLLEAYIIQLDNAFIPLIFYNLLCL